MAVVRTGVTRTWESLNGMLYSQRGALLSYMLHNRSIPRSLPIYMERGKSQELSCLCIVIMYIWPCRSSRKDYYCAGRANQVDSVVTMGGINSGTRMSIQGVWVEGRIPQKVIGDFLADCASMTFQYASWVLTVPSNPLPEIVAQRRRPCFWGPVFK